MCKRESPSVFVQNLRLRFFLVQLPQYGHHQMYFSNLFGELLESLSQQTCLEKNNQGRLMIFLVAYRDFSLPGLLLDGCSF